MPPLPQNFNVVLGAGVFGIVCAATLYVIEHYRQDKRRHAMAQDLARLNTELGVLRTELDTLLASQKQKVKRTKKLPRKTDSIISSSTAADEYASAMEIDSSDLEFYDVSDDEITITSLEAEFQEIDPKLEVITTVEELEKCLFRLTDLCIENPGNPEPLWRIAKAHHRLYLKTKQAEHLSKGIEACQGGLKLKPELANMHKWIAMLLGERSNIQPIKERILDGYKFKEHVDRGLSLDPTNALLHHMSGRFSYDVAGLKWYERKVAGALFAEPPSATYEEALDSFLKADKIEQWKENLLFIAKCRLQLGQTEEALICLEKADCLSNDNGLDSTIDEEVKKLLGKCRS